jgi:hypothetical protein
MKLWNRQRKVNTGLRVRKLPVSAIITYSIQLPTQVMHKDEKNDCL